MNRLESAIFKINSDEAFNDLALDIFDYQYKNCSIYTDFVNALGRTKPAHYSDIPFLPISFFKSHKVISNNLTSEVEFLSSGTGGERSHHFVHKKELYETSFRKGYNDLIGNIKNQVILALLPNYLEQGDSSLVYMVNDLIHRTENNLSSFILDQPKLLLQRYNEAIKDGHEVVIFGVSYALLDLISCNPDLSEAIIIETGGMKGRRKELTKNKLHQTLREGLHCKDIRSEYGMTELLSQAYSLKQGVFSLPSTMRVLIRDVNDPLNYVSDGKTGGINVIDLANLYSCSFIATQDLGKINQDGFEIMGRFDNSDIRGCNLLVQ